MWSRFSPSLSSQLVLLIVIVLIVIQGLNLFFLIGERRIAARATQFDSLAVLLVDSAGRLSPEAPRQLPYIVRQGTPGTGTVFLSRNNRSALDPNGRARPRMTRDLTERLRAAGISHKQVFVVLRPVKTGERPGARIGPPLPSGGPRPDERPPRDRPQGRPGPPGPPGPPVFRPDAPPDQAGPPAPGLEEILMSVELSEGLWLNAMVPHYAAETITLRAGGTAVFTLLFAIACVVVIARHVMRPIKRLTVAAEAFGRGAIVDTIPETGPADIQAAARAFNAMQNRLSRLITTQRSLLRAIGHDLRTPLTSLRIRAEDVPESHGRDRMIATLEDMTVMTEEILGWAKDASAIEPIAPVDITALLQSLTDDYGDQALPVTFESHPNALIVPCRRVALRRAIANLIDNALSYGKTANVSLKSGASALIIYVEDEGPGIPTEQIPVVLQPFQRLEQSRNKATGGVGLGLSIAQTIIESHGGTLSLENRQTGGLRAIVRLPL